MPTSTSEGDILTLKQVAEFLKVTERTIYRLAAAKKIPAFKVGGTWRFSKAEITEWIQQQSKGGKADKTYPQEGLMTQQTESNEQMEQSLIDIAVESWRFSRLFGKVVSKLDAGESGRYANQLRYFQKKVEESLKSNGLKLVNVEGQPFDPGMAASALNVGDFGPDDVLLVDQMVEPIIMGPNGLRKQGTVMLRKVEA